MLPRKYRALCERALADLANGSGESVVRAQLEVCYDIEEGRPRLAALRDLSAALHALALCHSRERGCFTPFNGPFRWSKESTP